MNTASTSPLSTGGDLDAPVPALSQVADLLMWESVSDLPSRWRMRYERTQERLINELCQRRERDGHIVTALAMLPRAQRLQFLRAPMVASRLLDSKYSNAQLDDEFLARTLLAEFARAGIVSALPASLWNAQGNRYLRADMPTSWRAAQQSLGATGILIDESSPYVFPFDDDGFCDLELLGPAERADVKEKLIRVFETLRESSEVVYRFVVDLVEVIAIRARPQRPDTFYASSFSWYVRLLLLTNPQLDYVGAERLINALVHESIHSLLFMYEASATRFVTSLPAAKLEITSPWSGVTLSLAAYLHACAVWYGLYWFWNWALHSDIYPESICRERRAYARAGFVHRPVSRHLARFHDLLCPDAHALLQTLETRILTA